MVFKLEKKKAYLNFEHIVVSVTLWLDNRQQNRQRQ